jgi:hypothetical protein
MNNKIIIIKKEITKGKKNLGLPFLLSPFYQHGFKYRPNIISCLWIFTFPKEFVEKKCPSPY